MRRGIGILIFFLLVLAIGAGANWYLQRAPAAPMASTTTSATSSDATIVQPSTTEYDSPTYHFKLLYPSDFTVNEYDEDDGSHTTTFEGASPGDGFQISVRPYTSSYITPERFKTDDPSGVMLQAQDIAIDGAPAKIFFGKNNQMGETREVWFIHGGFLYEVTTYKALDSWLGDIMITWKFI